MDRRRVHPRRRLHHGRLGDLRRHRWRSFYGLHIDIQERLEAGETPSAIAAEIVVDIDLVEGVIGDAAPMQEELIGLLLDARREVQS